ncbi:hypothetical protein MMC24_002299 [Lignoscripta atroalba]|nr:hypothetical protein [Lignoscripta atroalba]
MAIGDSSGSMFFAYASVILKEVAAEHNEQAEVSRADSAADADVRVIALRSAGEKKRCLGYVSALLINMKGVASTTGTLAIYVLC